MKSFAIRLFGVVSILALSFGFAALVARADDAAPTNAELKRQLDVLASELQKFRTGGGDSHSEGVKADRSTYSFAPGASKVYRSQPGFSLGGYGQLVYDNYAGSSHAGVAVADDELRDKLDLLQAVLYVGYKFDDHWIFNSETEFEHVGTEHNGAINVEFAYLDYISRPELNFRGGIMLIPMGLVNEYHEPTVYLGVHRPEVETLIVPSTWGEAGVGVFGELGAFSYRSYLVTGLNASGFDAAEGIREGRQGGGNAIAESFANVTRLDYTGTPGLLAGFSFFLGNSVTNIAAAQGGGITIPMHLYEAHLEYKYRGLQFRALGAYNFLSKVEQLNAAKGLVGADSVGNEQRGYYLELGYDLFSGEREALIPFARWEDLNTQMAVPTGYVRDPANYRRNLTLGVNYKPIEQLVFKAEFNDALLGDDSGVNRWSMSAGYVF